MRVVVRLSVALRRVSVHRRSLSERVFERHQLALASLCGVSENEHAENAPFAEGKHEAE